MQQIDSMAVVYSHALFVIVVAYGNGVNYGIPGITYARRVEQLASDLPGLRAINHVYHVIEPLAVWYSRGWTYQEAVLARRRLTFTSTQVYFECEHPRVAEDDFSTTADRGARVGKLFKTKHTSVFEAYQKHVGAYSTRALSFPGDTYAAFAGILKSLFGSNATHFGLPKSHFARALCWETWREASYTRDWASAQYPEDAFRELQHPSWAWSPNKGPSVLIVHDEQHFSGALSVWQTYNLESGHLELLANQDETDIDKDWRIYMAIASHEGCTNHRYSLALTEQNWDDVIADFSSRWEDYSSFHAELHDASMEVSFEALKLLQDIPGTILSRVASTFFHIIPRHFVYMVVNTNGQTVGWILERGPRLKHLIDLQGTTEVEEIGKFEFIALTLDSDDISDAETYMELHNPTVTAEDCERNHVIKRWADKNGELTTRVPIVLVMLIRREGDVAHREALGRICLKDWVAAPREWKTVVLQ